MLIIIARTPLQRSSLNATLGSGRLVIPARPKAPYLACSCVGGKPNYLKLCISPDVVLTRSSDSTFSCSSPLVVISMITSYNFLCSLKSLSRITPASEDMVLAQHTFSKGLAFCSDYLPFFTCCSSFCRVVRTSLLDAISLHQ